jgi:DNA-damage-inducible protein J
VILLGKTNYVKSRIDNDIKIQVEKILEKMGMTSSEAIRLYFHQILLNQGLPFEIKIPHIPNKTTIDAIIDSENGQLTKVDSIEKLTEELK